MKKHLFILSLLLLFSKTYSQTYPAFGNEVTVGISGLPFEAMEPFISPDGNYLFFNNLNDGINTSLYFAYKVTESSFFYMGEVGGVNQPTPPHLDAVASLDSANNFYFISTRNYPVEFDNLFHGQNNSGTVTNIGRVHGDFNIHLPGWLIMDNTINYKGDLLYYVNAYFNNDSCSPGMPCISRIGVARKVNDSTFNKLADTDSIFKNINDTAFRVYAPHITSDELELYYTRLQNDSYNTEICVSVRDNPDSAFSAPYVIFSSYPNVPEAPTLTTDKQTMYYHRKSGNYFRIYMRQRTGTVSIPEINDNENIKVFPNPANRSFSLIVPSATKQIQILNSLGQIIQRTSVNGQTNFNIELNENGIYFIQLTTDKASVTKKLIVCQ
jgi:hypothetical protein